MTSNPCILCKTKENYPRCRKTCIIIIRLEQKRRHDQEAAKAEKEKEQAYKGYKNDRIIATGKSVER